MPSENRGLQFINRLADITTIEVYGYRKEDDRRHGLKSQAVSAYVSGRPELSPKINRTWIAGSTT